MSYGEKESRKLIEISNKIMKSTHKMSEWIHFLDQLNDIVLLIAESVINTFVD